MIAFGRMCVLGSMVHPEEAHCSRVRFPCTAPSTSPFVADEQHCQFHNYVFISSPRSENTPCEIALDFPCLPGYHFHGLGSAFLSRVTTK